MAEQMVQVAGKKKQQKSKKTGAQTSSSAHKAGIVRSFASLSMRKLRRVAKSSGSAAAAKYAKDNGLAAEWKKIEATGLVLLREAAAERRQAKRDARAARKLEAARARHEAKRAAEAATKAAEALKAKRSAAAKKAAATRAANKAAKLTGQPATETQTVS